MDQHDQHGQTESERWMRLVTWIQTKGLDISELSVEPRVRKDAGRGLFATRTLHPSKKPFLVIPAKALLNVRTLSPIYPTIPLEGLSDADNSAERVVLTGIQLLSIHLALYKPVGDSFSMDPHFGPYIDSLPREFDCHPLTWSVKEKLGMAGPHEVKLLHNMPLSATKELQAVANRFWQDWDVANKAKTAHLAELQNKNEAFFGLHEFLWGWLVVNTRSLYADVFEGRLPQSNLTLCPVIEFANHTCSSTVPRAEWRDAPIRKNASKHVQSRRGSKLLKGRDYIFVLPEQTVTAGEEIFLKYGYHTNSTLFVEYGFVDKDCEYSLMDASDLVEELIAKKSASVLIKHLLMGTGSQFISDLKLYTTPPAHASWYLHLVLQLINLEYPSSHPDPDSVEVEQILQPWQDVIMGKAETVSDANETLVRHDLKLICEASMDRCSGGTNRLADRVDEEYDTECSWYEWARSCVASLWEEEGRVAREVLDSLAKGQAL